MIHRLVTIGLLVTVFSAFTSEVQAAEPTTRPVEQIDKGALVKEAMQMAMKGDQMDMAIWFPYELVVALNIEKGQTWEQVAKNVAFLKGYHAFIIQRSMSHPSGHDSYQSKQLVEKNTVLRLTNGIEVKPLKKVPPMVSAMMAAIKVMMNAEGDASGKNMHVLMFPSSAGTPAKPIVNVMSTGKITLALKTADNYTQTVLTWRTPFDAMTKAPPCQKCKENVSAKWKYCPYCGHKLGATASKE